MIENNQLKDENNQLKDENNQLKNTMKFFFSDLQRK